MKRYATAHGQDVQRDDMRHPADQRAPKRQIWPRNSGRDLGAVLPRDNQVVRGLVVGLPLALGMWAVLAILAWMIF